MSQQDEFDLIILCKERTKRDPLHVPSTPDEVKEAMVSSSGGSISKRQYDDLEFTKEFLDSINCNKVGHEWISPTDLEVQVCRICKETRPKLRVIQGERESVRTETWLQVPSRFNMSDLEASLREWGDEEGVDLVSHQVLQHPNFGRIAVLLRGKRNGKSTRFALTRLEPITVRKIGNQERKIISSIGKEFNGASR